jgi:hypothetical protein
VRARVRLGTEWYDIAASELAAYVSEEQNPGNEKGVGVVEVFVPNSLLASGMCLVDTPGIGSVITANTETTRAFVPHIDAALVVIGADPPISADEVTLIEQIAQHVHALIFVLSKADRLTETERREASAFARKVLALRLGKRVGPIFEVSATERLGGGEPSRDWLELEAALAILAANAGADLVRQAERRGSQRLAQRLLNEIAEQRDALVRPVQESEQRIVLLRARVAEAERALNDLGPLLSAEQTRLSATFKQQWKHFIAQAFPAARADLATALRQVIGHRGRARRQAIQVAQGVAARWGERWLDTAEPAAAQLYRAAAQRFVEVANGFLDRADVPHGPFACAMARGHGAAGRDGTPKNGARSRRLSGTAGVHEYSPHHERPRRARAGEPAPARSRDPRLPARGVHVGGAGAGACAQPAGGRQASSGG